MLGSRGDAFENELLGMAHQPCQKADLITTDDMTDFLFFDKSKSKVIYVQLWSKLDISF